MSIPKTALVTGGATRIGKAICEGLCQAGYAVAVHHNASSENADALVTSLASAGGRATAVQADLTNSSETRGLVSAASNVFGPLGLLINNASIFEHDGFDAADEDLWNAHFDIHVKAPSILTSTLHDQLPAGAEGLAINVIDQRVWKPAPRFASYTLSKNALWTATRTMAQTFAPRLRVNAIGPGPTLPSSRQTQESFDEQVATLLLKRTPGLGEFVNTVLYFVEAKSVTGQMIALDGGQHLAWETADQLVEE